MKPIDQTELIFTLVLFFVLLGLAVFCGIRLNQPTNPLKPRMFPYSGAMLLLAVMTVATAAHAFTLYAGVRIAVGGKPVSGQ
jgi:hypothetical protein